MSEIPPILVGTGLRYRRPFRRAGCSSMVIRRRASAADSAGNRAFTVPSFGTAAFGVLIAPAGCPCKNHPILRAYASVESRAAGDLAPTESRGDSSQNCLHDV